VHGRLLSGVTAGVGSDLARDGVGLFVGMCSLVRGDQPPGGPGDVPDLARGLFRLCLPLRAGAGARVELGIQVSTRA
jgi:hypothetical protein